MRCVRVWENVHTCFPVCSCALREVNQTHLLFVVHLDNEANLNATFDSTLDLENITFLSTNLVPQPRIDDVLKSSLTKNSELHFYAQIPQEYSFVQSPSRTTTVRWVSSLIDWIFRSLWQDLPVCRISDKRKAVLFLVIPVRKNLV